MELESATNLSKKILREISTTCSRAEVAGSVRRKKSAVKDIEIVAIVTDYDLLFERLAKVGQFIKPSVPDVIPWSPKPGAKYVRMLLNEGVKLDLFVASEENWGSLLTMRTGPAAGPDGEYGFVPAMFAAWKRRSGGGRMLGCVPTLPDGTQVPAREEADFFNLCGVKWVDPELRFSSRDVKRF